MNIYIPFAIFFIAFSVIAQKFPKAAKTTFVFVMLATLVFLCLRYEFGPDYFQYRSIYETINSKGLNYYLERNEHIENFFLTYLSLFPSYFLFIATQSVLWIIVIYLFLYKKIDYNHLWIVLFLFFFDINIVIHNTVALRSSLVGILFLCALYFLLRGGLTNKLVFCLLILLAGSIHNSAYPLLVVSFIPLKKGTFFSNNYNNIKTIILLIIIVSFFAGDIISNFSNYIIAKFPDLFGKYSFYMDYMYKEQSLSLGNLIFLIINTYCLSKLASTYYRETDNKYAFIIKLSILSTLASIIFGNVIMGRFVMTFAPLYIVSYIRAFHFMTKKEILYLTICLLFNNIFAFYSVMHTTSAISFLEYKTIIPYI